MGQARSHQRLPWAAASAISPMAAVVISIIGNYVVFSSQANTSAYSATYIMAGVIVPALVALLVGYLFRGKFEYPLRGVFLTCLASSFLMILAVSLFPLAAHAISNGSAFTNLALTLSLVLVNSIIDGAILAALIVAGVALRQHFL